MEQLDRVYEYLTTKDPSKPKEGKGKIGPGDLLRVLTFLGLKPLRSEANLIIWEVDDDLDGYVSKEEYLTMYRRCISEIPGLYPELEPKKLFNLVQFLMYDKEFKGRVTVEETLQILYVRNGRENLDKEITAIFGDEEKNADGTEK